MSESPPTVSLCLIAKDERVDLPRCLASVQPHVDEMVVIDTGSGDDTPELAAQLGARVEYFTWCDDFAAARNYALAQVRTDWVLVLDADEELVVAAVNWRDALTQPLLAYSLPLTDAGNPHDLTPLWVPRLFRQHPDLRYVGNYHERLFYRGGALPMTRTATLSDLGLIHYGYSPERLQDKELHRNIPMLERLRHRQGLSFLLLYSLAGMYTNTGQLDEAQSCYAEAGDRLLPHLLTGEPPTEFGYVPSLLFNLGVQALQAQDLETAQLLAQRGLEWCPTFPPLIYFAGATVRALGFRRGRSLILSTV
ncbi:MAG: glycosyltransferase family 2 protein [Spirulinaceae cyanobacterium RM2_2_10]|nr:glycosyltransferase family 2 protein [Spirulinaceae cyanobacterium RM2_2_10]